MTRNESKPGWLHCHTCRRLGLWWELNTFACNHGDGCVLKPPPPHERALLAAAQERLAWLHDEYGPDDIDYLTFSPIVALACRGAA